MSVSRVLIMAGGTGGHVFPALAVADAFREHGSTVTWLGSRQGLENRLVPERGYVLDTIRVSGLRGKGRLTLLLAPFKLMIAVWQAIAVIRNRQPNVVLGLGGFASGPGGVAAWLLRRPLVIHEQNAIPGLTNRVLSRLARRVLEAFPGSLSAAHACTGNPVRAAIEALPIPAVRYAGRNAPLRVLVVGGSLGARALNEVVPQAAALLDDIVIRHQVGKGRSAEVRARYAADSAVEVSDFIDDMAAAYAWADVAICRAGAMTIAELAAAGLPAVLVPYPYAVDDHQAANARFLVDAGGALMIREAALDATTLAAQLRGLASDRTALLAMADAARQVAKPGAAESVRRICTEVAA